MSSARLRRSVDALGSGRAAYVRSRLPDHGWRASALRYSPCGSTTSSAYLPLVTITPAASTIIRLDLPMPVVAKMPTWVARLAPGIPTLKSTTVSPLRS